jgi:Flp pilus assembly pilin Flp
MGSITRNFVRAREYAIRKLRGQTMTECALLLASIAVVVFGTYRAMGNNIGSLAKGVDSTLTNA